MRNAKMSQSSLLLFFAHEVAELLGVDSEKNYNSEGIDYFCFFEFPRKGRLLNRLLS